MIIKYSLWSVSIILRPTGIEFYLNFYLKFADSFVNGFQVAFQFLAPRCQISTAHNDWQTSLIA